MAATILNVDDLPENLHARKRILTDAGFRVLEASNANDALDVIRAEHPNLVLLGVRLPDMSGFELCRILKRDPTVATTYVLLISAEFRGDEDWARGLEAGADGYVRTPIEPAPLVQMIRALLRRQQAEARSHALSRAADGELRASERRWRALFEHAPYGIFRASAEGRLALANPALAATLGYASVEQLRKVPLSELLQGPMEKWNTLHSNWNSDAPPHPVEATWSARDGRPVVLLLWGRRIDERGDMFEVFAQDRTELRRLEEEFRQAQKMEAVGQLAGGIAHDFNNLLTAILGYSEMAIDQMPGDSALTADLREIRQAAQRAAALTQQLLAFSRRQVLRLQPTNVNRIVGGMEQMLRRLIGEHIHVELRQHPSLPLINADAAQLEQVVLNLAVNARDAMPDGGTLTMTTALTDLAPGALGQTSGLAGTYVVLSVRDTGEGMDAETQSRIFEPFFTTKARGKGTGLGLSTVYGIVQQLSGSITVESSVREGTTFYLYFPALTAGARDVDPGESDCAAERRSGRETILLVEDEDVLRRLAYAVLVRQGYRVLEANGPAEALALSERHSDAIDLILADVLMPGMRGWEMVERIKPQQPRARVLYMSGYIDELETARDRVTPLLSKPFKPRELLEHIRKVLDASV